MSSTARSRVGRARGMPWRSSMVHNRALRGDQTRRSARRAIGPPCAARAPSQSTLALRRRSIKYGIIWQRSSSTSAAKAAPRQDPRNDGSVVSFVTSLTALASRSSTGAPGPTARDQPASRGDKCRARRRRPPLRNAAARWHRCGGGRGCRIESSVVTSRYTAPR
jgi:hypothetical protein